MHIVEWKNDLFESDYQIGHTILNEKRKESKNYTVPLSGAKYSDLCSIFVLPICKDSLLKPFYDKQNGTGKNLCRSSELYRSA